MSATPSVSDWRHREYIDWLVTPPSDRDPETTQGFADKIGVTTTTLHAWKRTAEFLAAWEYAYRKTIGSPEKQAKVMNELLATAQDRTDPRQVQAARLYLETVEAVKPKKVDVTVTNGRAAKDLSDDELLAMLADRAARELENRDMDRAE
jgi:hypothetical protein